MKAFCKYGNHEYETQVTGTGYFYTDLDNGIANNTPTCPDCYKQHVLKYYPDSSVAKSFRREPKQPDLFKTAA